MVKEKDLQIYYNGLRVESIKLVANNEYGFYEHKPNPDFGSVESDYTHVWVREDKETQRYSVEYCTEDKTLELTFYPMQSYNLEVKHK
jgi:hypothetical protein